MSDTRFSELLAETTPLPPLFSWDEVKEWFQISDPDPTPQMVASISAISAAIRSYTGRVLTAGVYVENFPMVTQEKTARYLVEVPIAASPPPQIEAFNSDKSALLGPQDLETVNSNTGLVNLFAGPWVSVTYTGGYNPMPDDLKIVFMELFKAQMAQFGVTQFSGGSVTVNTPQERAVAIGSLRVEYAISANSDQARAATAGGISGDALAPWASVLDNYKARGRLVAT